MATTRNKVGFSFQKVCDIAGISRHHLRYWTEIKLIKASVSEGRSPRQELRYNVRDVLNVLIVKELRAKGLSLQKIRRSIKKVQVAGITNPLAKLRVACIAHTVFFKKDGRYFDPISGQLVIEQALEEIRPRVERRRFAQIERAVENSTRQFEEKMASFF